jgi:hypothetical protein
MRLFGFAEAQHYCRGFVAVASAAAEGSQKELLNNVLRSVTVLNEGSTNFETYRACALRNVERSLFQAASLYRRSFDLMTASAADWAHVSLYYGAFHSAGAILGMFGGFLDPTYSRVEVTAGNIGTQELRIFRKGAGAWVTTYNGTHKIFWDYFYRAATSLLPIVSARYAFGLRPVNGQVDWMIRERNLVNYDAHVAVQLAGSFQTTFRRTSPRRTLPGSLSTQFLVFEALLLTAESFARRFGLATDGLAGLSPAGRRGVKIENLVFNAQRPNSRLCRRRGIAT